MHERLGTAVYIAGSTSQILYGHLVVAGLAVCVCVFKCFYNTGEIFSVPGSDCSFHLREFTDCGVLKKFTYFIRSYKSFKTIARQGKGIHIHL